MSEENCQYSVRGKRSVQCQRERACTVSVGKGCGSGEGLWARGRVVGQGKGLWVRGKRCGLGERVVDYPQWADPKYSM